MQSKQVLLSFDIEEFDLPTEYGVPVPEDDLFEISRAGTENILDIVNDCEVPVTFFITGRFAEKYPQIIRKMAAAGHEIASHGYSHSDFEENDLLKAKNILQDIAQTTVVGFRMPRLKAPMPELIKKAGYLYDSSMNPTWIPGRYCHLRKPLTAYQEDCGLYQYPVSVVPAVRFPLFWLSFKNLPLPLYKTLSGITLKMTTQFNLYSHPWEYHAAAADLKWGIPRYIVRHAGREQCERLRSLILYLRRQGGTFTTIKATLPTHP